MTNKSNPSACRICKTIPDNVGQAADIDTHRQKLTKIAGQGHYYRGEEYQLSKFSLRQCPECDTYYEDAHHYYSDPQSTMGLARDEDDWVLLTRLRAEQASERLQQLT